MGWCLVWYGGVCGVCDVLEFDVVGNGVVWWVVGCVMVWCGVICDVVGCGV